MADEVTTTTSTNDDDNNDAAETDFVKRLRAALRVAPDGGGGDLAMTAVMKGRHPADIADALERLKRAEALAVFNWLDNTRAAEVLDEVEGDLSRFLVDYALPGRIADLLDRLPMDDAAEVLAEASPERAEVLLADLSARSPEDAAEVRELLSYPNSSAGRLMTDKFVRLSATQTVDEAFVTVRTSDPDVETLSDLYVVEGDEETGEKLVGVLSLRDLVRAQPTQTIGAVMTRNIIAVHVDTDQEEVARLISKYDFLAMPVLDARDELVGIITVDDIIDVLAEEQSEDLLKQGGITAEPGVLNQSYFSVPIWRSVRSRVPWLVLLFVASTFTGSVLEHFDNELDKVAALTFFIPLIIGTGGNTGAQTVSSIIRGLSLKEITTKDTLRVLMRELGSGLLLGLLLSIIAFGRAFAGKNGFQLSLVVALTILAVCAWSNTIASLIPLLARRFKIDPALVSAPLITTLVDATGLAIYLLIAKAILAQLQ